MTTPGSNAPAPVAEQPYECEVCGYDMPDNACGYCGGCYDTPVGDCRKGYHQLAETIND